VYKKLVLRQIIRKNKIGAYQMLKTLKYIPLIIILLMAIWFITIFMGSSKAYSDNSTFIAVKGGVVDGKYLH
jgi:hypothetical protein